jgi:hypothetical protein
MVVMDSIEPRESDVIRRQQRSASSGDEGISQLQAYDTAPSSPIRTPRSQFFASQGHDIHQSHHGRNDNIDPNLDLTFSAETDAQGTHGYPKATILPPRLNKNYEYPTPVTESEVAEEIPQNNREHVPGRSPIVEQDTAEATGLNQSGRDRDPVLADGTLWSFVDYRWSDRPDLTFQGPPFWDSRGEFTAHFSRISKLHRSVGSTIAQVVGYYRAVKNETTVWQHEKTQELCRSIREVVLTVLYHDPGARLHVSHLDSDPSIEEMEFHLDYIVYRCLETLPSRAPLSVEQVSRVKAFSAVAQLAFYEACAFFAIVKMRNIILPRSDPTHTEILQESEIREAKMLLRIRGTPMFRKAWPVPYGSPAVRAGAVLIHTLVVKQVSDRTTTVSEYQYAQLCRNFLEELDAERQQRFMELGDVAQVESAYCIFVTMGSVFEKLIADLDARLVEGEHS